jgi:hypothetical protein
MPVRTEPLHKNTYVCRNCGYITVVGPSIEGKGLPAKTRCLLCNAVAFKERELTALHMEKQVRAMNAEMLKRRYENLQHDIARTVELAKTNGAEVA